MEKFSGTLTVERINGRRGPFCVGMLKISIGQFKIKDQALEQFEPGTYSGQFIIEEIYTKGVPWRGGTFTELLARIADDGFLINDERQSNELPEIQAEPDPADDDQERSEPVTQPDPPAEPTAPLIPAKTHRVAAVPNLPVSQLPSDPSDERLFGVEIYALLEQRGQPIALDPTVDRIVFRQQRERLKAMGYKFVYATQDWMLDEAATASV